MKGILNLGSIGNREHIAEVFVWATFLCFNLTSPFKGGNKTARHLDTEMSPIPFADKPQEKEEGGGRKREPQTFTAVTPLSSFLCCTFPFDGVAKKRTWRSWASTGERGGRESAKDEERKMTTNLYPGSFHPTNSRVFSSHPPLFLHSLPPSFFQR